MPGWPLHLLQMFLVTVVILAPVPAALACVRRLGTDRHSALENVLAAVTLVVALQVALGLLLGSAGVLGPVALVAGEVLLLGAGLAMVRCWGIARVVPSTPLDPLEGGALTVVLIAGGLGLADLVVHPTRNFDSLAYHLPVMARWVSASRLEVFEALGQVALYPSHWELLSAMVHLPLGHDLLISAPNLLAWGQLGLAILLLARRLGAKRDAAIVSAALVLLMPSILSRLDAIQPDIALAATFLTALGFATRAGHPDRALDAVVLLLSMGLLAGLKLSGPVFVVMLLPVVLLGPRVEWGRPAALIRRLDPGRHRRTVAAVGVGAMLLGLFWYVRNWVELGNPFGDLQIGLLGAEIFEGSISRAELQRGALSNVFRVTDAGDWTVLGTVLWEWLGAGAAFLFLAALLAARRPAVRVRQRALVAILLLACLVLYWRTPYGGDNGTHGWRVTPWIEVGLRYGFPALGLVGVLGAVGASTGRWWPRAGLLVLVVTSVLTVLEELVPHIAALVFVVAISWCGAVLAMGRQPARRVLVGAGVVVLALATVGLGLAREQREARRARGFGRIVETLATELGDDDVVAVVNSQKLHLAAGLDWRRRVLLPELPVAGRESAWVASLRAAGVTAVLVGHQDPPADRTADVRRVQRFIRSNSAFELVKDYESQAKDLALFRLRRQSSR